MSKMHSVAVQQQQHAIERSCQPRRLKRTTSASWGSLGSGVERSDWSETRQVRRVKTGLQLDSRMSRQMKPVWDEMSAGGGRC